MKEKKQMEGKSFKIISGTVFTTGVWITASFIVFFILVFI